jgi:hypothetical protein
MILRVIRMRRMLPAGYDKSADRPLAARHDRSMTPAEPVNLTAALASFEPTGTPSTGDRHEGRIPDPDVHLVVSGQTIGRTSGSVPAMIFRR